MHRCLQLKLFGELRFSQRPWNRPLHFAGVSLGQKPLIPLWEPLSPILHLACISAGLRLFVVQHLRVITVRGGSLDGSSVRVAPRGTCFPPLSSCLFLLFLPLINLATPLPLFPLLHLVSFSVVLMALVVMNSTLYIPLHGVS